MKKLSNEFFEKFQRLLVEKSGLYFSQDRAQWLEEKLRERMTLASCESYEKYFDYIFLDGTGSEERDTLIENLTVGETYFFRNAPHFDALRKYVIPDLLSRKRSRTLKIWCAGCSTGEEPYSIAILLKEAVVDLDSWDLSILATDINRRALATAQKGFYNKRSVSHTPSPILQRYFVPKRNQHELISGIKKMVTFRRHNLITDAFLFEGMQEVDLLFCRNVTIYFNLETLKNLMAQFSASMVEKGYLFIGHAETLWNISTEFKAVEFPHTFIYQKSVEEPKEKKPSLLSIPIPAFERRLEFHEAFEAYSLKEAAKEISSPLPQKPPAPYEELMTRATELANQESYEESLESLETILGEDNLCAPAYYLKGILYVKLNRFEEAVCEFKRLLYAEPGFVMGYFHLGNLYLQLGENRFAKREYQNGIGILDKAEETSEVPYSEGLTAGILREAMSRRLEIILGGSRNGKK